MDNDLFSTQIHSTIAGACWPPVLTGQAATLSALLSELDRSAAMAPAERQALQHQQLARLAAYAARHSAHFAKRLGGANLMPDDLASPGALTRLPVLSRRDVQQCYETICCDTVPPDHLGVAETGTSGSLGQPVLIKRTGLNQLFWQAMTVREHQWHKRDVSGTLAVLRANLPTHGVDVADWGPPLNLLYKTGPAHGLSVSVPVADQVSWLARVAPHYLLTYPTNLTALLDHYERHGTAIPRLRQIRTIGETVTPLLRARTARVLNVTIADVYSSQEMGVIGIQSPGSMLYHLMAESHIVEILDDDDRPCAPGTVGRVVMTDLQNYAMPLIRYDTGDYAEAGGAAPGPRGLPTLARVMGRKRNMMLVNGQYQWPTLNPHNFRKVAPVHQFQLVQQTTDLIEVKLVCEPPITKREEAALAALIIETLGHPFRLQFRYFDGALPLGKSGKFEEFINLTAPAGPSP